MALENILFLLIRWLVMEPKSKWMFPTIQREMWFRIQKDERVGWWWCSLSPKSTGGNTGSSTITMIWSNSSPIFIKLERKIRLTTLVGFSKEPRCWATWPPNSAESSVAGALAISWQPLYFVRVFLSVNWFCGVGRQLEASPGRGFQGKQERKPWENM